MSCMAKKSDPPEREEGRRQADESLRREEALKALRRLREIGDKLPAIDAAVVVREGRDLLEL